MDESVKDDLVTRFRAYLDSVGADAADDVNDGGEGSDLYSLFVEVAGLRTEVRTESRLVKDALDQFRTVFDRLEKDHAALEREVERARSETRDQARTLLRPLLLELLDLRDRLEAGARKSTEQGRSWLFGFRRPPDPELDAWREGQLMTLRRLDRLLHDRQVAPLDVVGRPFDPRVGCVVSTVVDPSQDAGAVVEVVRAGFSWNGELLRPAEVVVNKPGNRTEGLSS